MASSSGFLWPFQAEATSEYQRVDQGWDLQTTAGAPVYAIASGVIGQANRDPGGFGNDYPYQTLDNAPSGAPSNTVYYGHIHMLPGLAGQHVSAGQLIGYTNTTAGQNGSGAPPGWLEIGFAQPGTGAPVQRGSGATGAGATMKAFLLGAALPGGGAGSAMTGTGGASNANPQVPNASDITGLDAYIRQNYPDEAWLLDVPEVKQVLEQAVAAGETSTQIQAAIQETSWWKHTSQNMISFLDLQHATPEELNFGDPGSKASQALAHVEVLAGTVGMGALPMATMKQIALNAMQYGWNDAQVQQKIGSYAWVKAAGQGVQSNDPQLLQQLTATAGKYLYNPTDPILQSYMKGLASGTMTLATFQAFLAQQAATKYPSMAQAIGAGQDPNSIIDPLRQEAARTMEMAPDQINFISDPFYSQILNYRPPPVGGKPSAPRVMSASEMDTYLRRSNQYASTQQARDQAAGLAKSIVTTFGKVAP